MYYKFKIYINLIYFNEIHKTSDLIFEVKNNHLQLFVFKIAFDFHFPSRYLLRYFLLLLFNSKVIDLKAIEEYQF